MNIVKNIGKYYFYNELEIIDSLTPGNYLLNFDEFGNVWLEDLEEFRIPEKIYDVSSDLRRMIKLSFETYSKNLGVLLTGNKGQGKSLTAKLLCNDMKLPTIILNKKIPSDVGFIKFLNNIKQDYILFVDEFEKLFTTDSKESDQASYHSQESFLTFMDGVLTTGSKILFLLTTNSQVNEYFINRPSRIKFLEEYDELSEELFDLIVRDKLINQDYREDLEENVSLINLNIDLLLSIIDDINLLDQPFSKFVSHYNYRFEKYRYEVYFIKNGAETFNTFWTSTAKLKHTDGYMAGYQVMGIIKFTKEEIIFKSTKWDEDEKGEDVKVDITIKLVPSKGLSIF